MQGEKNISFQSLTQTTEDIINKRISCLEVLESVSNSISKYNDSINAIVTTDFKAAIKEAKELDVMLKNGKVKGPLHGIPVTIKDNFEVSGMRSTASHKPFSENIPVKDASVVERLREAGAIIVGKTNLPELAVDFQTDSPIFGRTNNPWDLERTPGGSTGGGAAAVAAGMSFLDVGNDLLGSIRIPAHYCGIYGFVPSVHTISRNGIMPKTSNGGSFDQILRAGILARSVEDLITVFKVIKGLDNLDINILPIELRQKKSDTVRNLRIAWVDNAEGIPISRDTRQAITGFIDCLKSQEYTIDKIDSKMLGFLAAKKIFARIFYSNIGINMPWIVRTAARFIGKNKYLDLNLKKYITAEIQRIKLITKLDNILSDYDMIICPVMSTPAFHHKKPDRYRGVMPVYKQGIKVDETLIDYGDAITAFTIPFSITGNPVSVIPIGKSQEGLPIGIQIVGKRWSDLDLLLTAKKLAEYIGFLGHPPL